MSSNALLVQFGKRLTRLRESKGMNISEFAAHTGLSRGHLSELEHGKREPGLLILQTIAAVLETSISRLLSGL